MVGGVVGASVAVGGAGYLASQVDVDDAETLHSVTLGDGMNRALVVYATKSGCTTGVAEAVGVGLAQAGWTVDVRPAADGPDPAGYDMVLVGSGVRVGQWHEPARTWVQNNSAALKESRVALFTTCLRITDGEEARDEAVGYTDALIAEADISPEAVGVFPGVE